MLRYTPAIHIVFPAPARDGILGHCRRVLDLFAKGEAEEGKAFGLVFGSVNGDAIHVAEACPLEKNVRSQQPWKEYMDRIMAAHAVPSVTPLERRGWVADPAELFARIRACRNKGQILVGTYHMHRVGWEQDPLRDTPTRLDAVLAAESGLVMFIVSMVDPQRPVIRAFFEGVREKEIPLLGAEE